MAQHALDDAWREDDSQGFIDWGGFFVPDREVQMGTVASLIPPCPEGAVVVELCCGEGLLAREILGQHPGARLRALDGSPTMLEAAARQLSRFAGRFETALFDLPAAHWRRFDAPIHAFVSSLAIHHLSGAEKAKLFSDLHAALAPGGALIIADVTLSAGPMGKAAAAKAWDDDVRARSQSAFGDERALNKFHEMEWNMYRHPLDGIDQPSTLLEQLNWLQAAGFRDVDAYWMRAGHAIFGGYK